MPDLTIINNLEEPIHVAFFIAAPTHWKNHLQPNERWTAHLPTLPLYFQARWVERTDHDQGTVYASREFSEGGSWEMGATIGLACATGTASVVTGAASLLTGWGHAGMSIATPLMDAANTGKWAVSCFRQLSSSIPGGKRYAEMRQDAKLCETTVWVPWFEHKEFSVRLIDGRRCVLWDVKENKQV